MKIVRVCLLVGALAIVAAPLANSALAIWPFTSSPSTATKKMPKVTKTPKQEPNMMQKMWNGVTSPFSSKKETPKKPSKPIGFSVLTSHGPVLS